MNPALVTGWAGHPGQFPRLAAAGIFLAPFLDFEPEDLPGRLPGRGRLLVGWSTGAHCILRHGAELFPRFGLVLLLAPFARFTDSYPARAIRAMRRNLLADPAGTLAAFAAACGDDSPRPALPPDPTALARGLDFLAEAESAPQAPVPADNVLLVRGGADRIVREAAFQALLPLLPGAAVLTPDCGHLVPETFALEAAGARLGGAVL